MNLPELDLITKVQAFQGAASTSPDAETRLAYLALARGTLTKLEERTRQLATMQDALEKATPPPAATEGATP